MKEHKDIDKFFKDKLENLGSQGIPSSFLDDINNRLDNLDVPAAKHKKGKYKKIFYAIPFVGIIALFVYFKISEPNSKKEEKEHINEINVSAQSDSSKLNLQVISENEEDEKSSLNETLNKSDENSEDQKKQGQISNASLNGSDKANLKGNTQENKSESFFIGRLQSDTNKVKKTANKNRVVVDEKNKPETDSTFNKVTKTIEEDSTTTITTIVTTTIVTKVKKNKNSDSLNSLEKDMEILKTEPQTQDSVENIINIKSNRSLPGNSDTLQKSPDKLEDTDTLPSDSTNGILKKKG